MSSLDLAESLSFVACSRAKFGVLCVTEKSFLEALQQIFKRDQAPTYGFG